MTVESNFAFAIATLGDWLKNFAPVFTPTRRRPKPVAPCTRDFSRALSKVTSRNYDWFIALFALVAIGRSNYFGIGFSTVV